MHALTTIIAALLLAGGAQNRRAPDLPDSHPSPAAQRMMQQLEDQADAVRLEANDPPGDEAHPARNRQLVIPSGPVVPALGRPAEMNALFFLAAGAGPHPTMLLLHGLPGNERNLDLAQAVRRAGWNVLTFSSRGAWGSEGRFSIQNATDDTLAALAFLRSEAAVRSYGIDTSRIVVAGHSMGGYMAAHAAVMDARRGDLQRWITPAPEGSSPAPRNVNPQLSAFNRLLRDTSPPLAGVVLIDAWNIADDARQVQAAGAPGRAAFIAGFDDIGHSLGAVTAADLYDELMRGGTRWDLNNLGLQLARTRLLTVYATHGGAEPNRALAETIREACTGQPTGSAARRIDCPTLRAVELNSDHSFADARVALAREVVGWLALQRRE
jgi:pimeloyl-ACP methyl ester carboxylesterase